MSAAFFFSSAVAAVLLTGCVSAKKIQNTSSVFRNAFYKTKLSNGIPVIIKQNGTPGPIAVRLIIDGGAPFVPSDMNGLERITFLCMEQNTGSHDFRSEIYPDYSVYGYMTDMQNMQDKLGILAESFMNPVFDEKTFTAAIDMMHAGLRSETESVSLHFAGSVKRRLYEGHPYYSSVNATEASLRKITLGDVKAHHDQLLNAARLRLVAVGNFDEHSAALFVLAAEKLFRHVPVSAFTLPAIPPVLINPGVTAVPPDIPGREGYVIGCFHVPGYTDADYIPYALSTLYFDDMLRHSIQERNRLAVSAGTGLFADRQAVGIISVYNTEDTDTCRKLVLQSIRDFPDRSVIEKFLAQYKRDYIRRIVFPAENAGGEVAQLIAGIELCNDPEAYTKRSAQVNAVTAAQVVSSFKTYITEKNIHWYTVN